MGEDKQRGLSWSDMAVLLRSVKASAELINRALQEAGIPFIVTGMTNLFEAMEAEAARQLFYFIADRPGIDAASVTKAWRNAELGLNPRRHSCLEIREAPPARLLSPEAP